MSSLVTAPQAGISSSSEGKWRYTVPTPTPARAAMSSQLVAAMPCSPCSASVAATIRSRVRVAAAARLLMS